MQKLVIASQNRDKLKEIKALIEAVQIEIVNVGDILPEFEVIEDKDTILGNAAKKALETAQATGLPALADDTGLFIEALNGEPGVYAARFAGEKCTYADNRNKALHLLKGIENRKAEFRTVVVLAEPSGVIAFREGIVQGSITREERGNNGFGYDAVFEVEGMGKTYAEMNNMEKNNCSHRGKALQAMLPFLAEYFGNNKTQEV
jgi:XTP/dITP diphosphohydrolase